MKKKPDKIDQLLEQAEQKRRLGRAIAHVGYAQTSLGEAATCARLVAVAPREFTAEIFKAQEILARIAKKMQIFQDRMPPKEFL